MDEPLQKGVYSLRKEFAPKGANSFLQELILIGKGSKTKSGRVASLKVYPFTIKSNQFISYRENSKNWDTLNYHPDCPTNGIVGFYSAILRSKDADRITNRVDTDQTAPRGAV